MIQKRHEISEVEQQRQVERQAAPRHLMVRGLRIARTEEREQWPNVPLALSSTLPTSEERFITDWADS